MKDLIPQETIEQRIFLIRNQKVMIDRDLAELYGVETQLWMVEQIFRTMILLNYME